MVLIIARLPFIALLLTTFGVLHAAEARLPARPNIVYILGDDLGYGDVSRLNPQRRITTPHLDRLARDGMCFTDAHSGSSVCTPTRYGLMTGRYAWRSRLKSGVLGGLSPRLIEPGRMTVASMLRAEGYHTACIGKWHLGMDWVVKDGKTVQELGIESREQVWNVDFSQPIRDGPNRVGFDYFYGISASLDMVPYAYIENDRVTREPERDGDFPWIGGRDRRTRRGPVAEGFDAADVLGEFTRRAVTYLGQRAAEARQGKPFFLYLPLASPHTPILPTASWQGKSGLNAYADFVMETDASVGQILRALDENGLAENTIVVFASDNGCSPEADFPALASAGHHPSGPFRGHKADLFEGGHRVPFFVRWPGRVAPGSEYPHPICLGDLLATCADVLGVKLPDAAAEDSVSLLPVWLGRTREPVRDSIVHHSINGSFAIRQGHWKLLLSPDSGGWSAPRPGSPDAAGLPPVQLYDLSQDPGEKHNLQAQHPAVVRQLAKLLEEQAARGRSTPGAPQTNTKPVDVWNGRNAVPVRQRPNIVFLISDDHAWTDYGFMGHKQIETPHLDKLASRSAVFTRGYVPTALCRPALASLATGLYAHQHKLSGNDPALLPEMMNRGGNPNVEPPAYAALREKLIAKMDEHPTIAKLLGQQGYVSHQSGKWWEGTYQRGGFTHGMTRGFPNPGGRHGDDGLKIGREGLAPVFEFIDQAVAEKKPFFIWFAPMMPHTPHTPPQRLFDKYKAKGVQSDFVARYHAMVEWFDETCGQLMDRIEAQGLTRDTLFVYLGDNGWIQDPNANGYAPRSKQSANEGGTRQPMLFSWPGIIQPGNRGEQLCLSVDILPTVLAAAGAPIPKNLPGFDLLPILRSGQPTPRDIVFGETFAHDVADIDKPEESLIYRWAIEGKWKLLLTYDGKVGRHASSHPRAEKRPQLFDLLADPHENTNLASRHPEIVARLAGKIAAWWPVTERQVITRWSE